MAKDNFDGNGCLATLLLAFIWGALPCLLFGGSIPLALFLMGIAALFIFAFTNDN